MESGVKKLEFLRKVKNYPRPLIVDLWAPWCTPCKAMKPALEQVSKKYSGQVDILKINVDESPEVMKEVGVMSIPTMIGYVKGTEILRRTGLQTAGMLDAFFEATMNEKKSAILPPAPAVRVFRTILGLGIMIAGWFINRSILLIALGGLVIFSGYYDRCPIFKAIFPRIKTLFAKPPKKNIPI
jgi:thioredoxin 1